MPPSPESGSDVAVQPCTPARHQLWSLMARTGTCLELGWGLETKGGEWGGYWTPILLTQEPLTPFQVSLGGGSCRCGQERG